VRGLREQLSSVLQPRILTLAFLYRFNLFTV
jgi:hypothetical protein